MNGWRPVRAGGSLYRAVLLNYITAEDAEDAEERPER
jgi:hypothetical protein